MRRREVITLFGVAAAAWPLAARGQQSGERRRRIGVLTPAPAQFNSETLLRALEQRGHKEGVNLVLAVASAEGRLDRLTSLAEEMSRGEFDVVVTVNTPATRAILAVPGTAPVVMAMVSDPIVLGFVDNLSRPTGRVTGVANMIHDLAQKRLALLKEAAPAVRRVAALFHPDDPIKSRNGGRSRRPRRRSG
jgi:putative tryptophan/tyrosine transport system substrate-binding protein